MHREKNKKRNLFLVITMMLIPLILGGCSIAGFHSKLGDIKGKLVGNSFTCRFYDNSGSKYLTVFGKKISLEGNVVEDSKVNSDDGSVVVSYGLSSVITVNIDGKQIQSCGDTIIFEEKNLKPDAEFNLTNVDSDAKGVTSNTYISNIINKYSNYFGKPQVVVIHSQLGVPICAYSGKDVYWEVCQNLPKTTKLMIDKKALYLHRANFQIIDKKLLNQ